MRISNLLRNCVAFVAVRKSDGSFEVRGTGFFIAKPLDRAAAAPVGDGLHRLNGMYLYFVTARHVIEGARSLGADQVWVRTDVPGSEPRFLPAMLSDFTFHPDSTVDYAVVHTEGNLLDGIRVLPWIYSGGRLGDSFVLDSAVGVGSPVSIIGLFRHHYGAQRNLPIVRTGNVAAMAEEPVNTRMGLMEAILVEARSIGGLSGSPVFVHTRPSFVPANPEAIAGIQLLGLMHGHFDEVFDAGPQTRERVNVGIGIVAPVSKLREIMTLPQVLEREAETAGRLSRGEQ